MARVINESPFSGWKEFTHGTESLRFKDDGSFWHVYRYNGSAFVHCAVIDKIKKESNRSLLARGIEACIDERED